MGKCIESIQKQSYSNLEIILVDDGSTDKSGALCDNYALNDDRIKVIHKENGGLSSARNVGIEKAKGQYISFIDGDDYINQEYIQKMYRTMKTEAADLVICNFELVDSQGKHTERLSTGEKHVGDILLMDMTVDSTEILNKYYSEPDGFAYVVAWNKLYTKSCFEEIRYPKGKIHEDEYVFYDIIFQLKKIVCLSEPLYYYVQREGSIMSSEKMSLRIEHLNELHSNRRKVLSDKNMEDIYMLDNQQFMSQIIRFYMYMNKEQRKKYKKIYKKIFHSTNTYTSIKRKIFYMVGMVSLYKISIIKNK